MHGTSTVNLRFPIPFATSMKHGMNRYLERLQAALARHHRYRQTVFELSSCSDRDLDDLGIARSDIHRIAREAQRMEREA